MRTSEAHLVTDLMRAHAAEPSEAIAYRQAPRCHVCSAADKGFAGGAAVRELVDDLLLVPKTITSIVRLIEPFQAGWPEEGRISRYGVMRHSRNHLKWEQAAARQIAERNAARAQKVDEA